MKTTFIIDGGLGRQITAIPALEKYVKNNPDTIIISHFWTPIVWGNPLLTDKIFDVGSKGLFNMVKDSKVIKPEPYYNTNYVNGKISLADAFNEEINGDNEKMPPPKLHLSRLELEIGRMKTRNKDGKVVCFQPFGSGATIYPHQVTDGSVRSFYKEHTLHIIERLKQANINIALFDDRDIPFIKQEDVLSLPKGTIRDWAAIIANCDYFFGVDSSGQHIARAFNIPGTVVVGGTNATNVSYPNHFTIIELDNTVDKAYMCMRLCDFDYRISEIQNGHLMDFSKKDIDDTCDLIISEIEKL